MSLIRKFSLFVFVGFGCFSMAALTGCGMGTLADHEPDAALTSGLGTIQGSNFGGHAPLVGARIFVLEATTGGYGAASTSLLTAASSNASFPTVKDTSGGATNGMYYVQTDINGAFNISGDYTCDVGQPVYLYAAGGAPSTVVGTPGNPATVNLAMLGVCSAAKNFSALRFVYINEVSTVAAAYAMAGFAKDSAHIGSSAGNLVGLQNAALNAATLYNIQGNGPSSTTSNGEGHIANAVNPNNSNGTVPQATINSLANIAASCVDSGNTTVGTTQSALLAEAAQCRAFFLSATFDGVTGSSSAGGADVPIDTATALINVAHFPAGVNNYPGSAPVDSSNPSTLYGLPTSVVPFSPVLTAAPKDWTIALTYKNIPTPTAIAIDAKGDAYIGTLSATAGTITELSPQGSVAATSSTSVPNMSALGVSKDSIVWATSHSNSQLYKFSSTLATSSTFTSAATLNPSALAIDGSGNVYVVNDSATYPYFNLSDFSSAGTVIYTPANYQFSVANGIALTSAGSFWITSTNSSLGLYPSPSSTPLPTPFPFGGTSNLDAVAVDYQGSGWFTTKTTGNQSLLRITTSGVTNSFGTNSYNNTAIGGINNPVGVAVDGNVAGSGNPNFNVWLANSGNNTVAEVNSSSTTSALSSSAGYQAGTGLLNSPSAIAVDNSGNVWVTNKGNSTVTEIIGSASPVTTPLAAMAPGVAP